MSFSSHYRQHNYMGEHADDASALSFIRAQKWDSSGDGAGNPRAGMVYFNTATAKIMYFNGSAWVDPSAAEGGSWNGILAIATKTSGYTAQTTDQVIFCNGTFTIDLYTASGNTGRVLHIKNMGTGTITLDASGSETIDGSLTKTITTQYNSLMLISDGTNWGII